MFLVMYVRGYLEGMGHWCSLAPGYTFRGHIWPGVQGVWFEGIWRGWRLHIANWNTFHNSIPLDDLLTSIRS